MNKRRGGSSNSHHGTQAIIPCLLIGLVSLAVPLRLSAQSGAQPGQSGEAGRGSQPRPSTTTQSGPGQTSQSGPNQTPTGQSNTPPGNPPQGRADQQRSGGQQRAPGEPTGTTSQGGVLQPSGQQNRGNPLPSASRVVDAPAVLTLDEAVRIAFENNLSTLLASEGVQLAQGQARELLARLLQNLSGSVIQENRTVNLAAQGFALNTPNAPFSFPTFVGPFNTFDARLFLTQTIFSLSAIRDYRSGRAAVRVAELQTSLAREQIASAVALSYLNVLREDLAVQAATADLELAQALLKLAQDQRAAGIATGIDVVRAENSVVQQRLRLAQAQGAAEQSRLTLERVIGVRQGSTFSLSDQLSFRDEPPAVLTDALMLAAQNRAEIRIGEAFLQQRELIRRARAADQYPSLEAFGDYGSSGNTPVENARTTHTYGVRLNVPIFNGGLTRGRVQTAASQEREAASRLSDTRGQVEEDVRLAYVSLRTGVEQVRAAEEGQRLAERELQLARDRFQAGLGDNIELIQAQTALQVARSNRVAALAAFNAARVNLAAALGQAERFRF